MSSGETHQAEKPSWVSKMPVGRWYRISGDHPDLDLPVTPIGTRYLQDNDPAQDPALNPSTGPREFLRRLLGESPNSPWRGRLGFPAITEAWNGAVLASKFGQSGAMIVFGGGHDDYFGSDVHAFDLNTRQWSRISDGYVTGRPEEYGAGAVYPNAEYRDRSPLPPHTYDYVQYDPVGNDYILFKGQTELGPKVKATPIPHMFNLDTLTWRRGPMHPSARLNAGGWTTWDASRRLMWGNSGDYGRGNAFIGFSPYGDNGDGTFGSWGTLYPNKLVGAANHNAMKIDPVRDIIVVAVHALDALYAIDPSDPEKPVTRLSSAGTKPKITEYAAIEYAPSLDRFVYYSANDGAHVYSIEAPSGSTWPQLTTGTWVWRKILDEENTLDPIADAAAISSHQVNRSHTFGRFRVAAYESTDVAIVVRHIDTPIYAMRLTRVPRALDAN